MDRERWADIEVALVVAALIAIGVISFGPERPSVAAGPPTETELVEFGRQARAACECEAQGGAHCWEAFTARAQARGAQIAGTACAPVSATTACFGDHCLPMRYSYVGPGPNGLVLCDADDARAIDRTFSAVRERSGSHEVAVRETQRVAEAIARGEKVRLATARPGCAG